MVVNVGTAC